MSANRKLRFRAHILWVRPDRGDPAIDFVGFRKAVFGALLSQPGRACGCIYDKRLPRIARCIVVLGLSCSMPRSKLVAAEVRYCVLQSTHTGVSQSRCGVGDTSIGVR